MERDGRRAALERIAAGDPELAARLVLMTMPAAAARIPGRLTYGLEIDGLGSHRVEVQDGKAQVSDGVAAGSGETDFSLQADPRTLVDLASGAARPLGLMMKGRLRIRGKRRRALRLRRMSGGELSMADVLDAGGTLDPDVLYRALPHLIDPDWTRGHDFTVRYVVTGRGGGDWYVHVRDGQPVTVTGEPQPGRQPAGTASVSFESYQRLASGRLNPSEAMQEQLTTVEGQIHPITLLGRWIARSQGSDDAELERESRQRALQEERALLYTGNGAGPAALAGAVDSPGQGDPGHESERGARQAGGLLDYRQLYALWERQNWRASELDFSVDREQWVTTPTQAQESTLWSLGAFYVGEERVTADLAPFLLAAPTGEIELFLATQLVDEARHTAFFDRFGAEVMCLSSDDLRGRMREVEEVLLSPWRDVFDDGLRDVARRIQARPDDLDLFVEGITVYHMVVEGFLAVTGQTLIRDYFSEHGMYPGFCEGFGLVERDEHRHVAFGVRFLRDAIEEDPRHRATVERVVLDLAPRAAYVFTPPYVSDPHDYVSYGYSSRQMYGFAYRTLKRRMKVLGIELPPPEEFMPGPIDEPGMSTSPATNGGPEGATDAVDQPAEPERPAEPAGA